MDEFRQVRELYDDLHGERSAPAPEVIERTRSALRAGDRPRRRPNNAVAGVVALAAVAGVTAAIVVPTLVPGPSDRAVVRTNPAPTVDELPSAGAILERAAVAADQWATPTGEHWRVRTLTGSTPAVETRTGQVYELHVRSVHECWAPRASDECVFSGLRQLGAEPLTAEDERVWRQDGAPSYWKVRVDGGGVLEVSTRPGKGELSKLPYVHAIPPRPVVPLAREPLPVDPERLRAMLTKLHRKTASASSTESWLYRSAVELLVGYPSSPSLDAAVFRMLGRLPGLTIQGPASDGIGREGVALELAGETDLPALVFDPDTGELLGANYDGDQLDYRVRLDAGWTDHDPTPPSVR